MNSEDNKGVKVCENDERWMYFCPACGCYHGPTKGQWKFNGDYHRPTFSPSILVNANTDQRCHHFVRDGKIQYLSDCKHRYAGQTVDVPDVDCLMPDAQ